MGLLRWWGDASCPFLNPKSFPWSCHGLSEGHGKVTVGATSFSNISFQQSFADIGQGKGFSTVKNHTGH